MKLPEPTKHLSGMWQYQIAPDIDVFIDKMPNAPRKARWVVDITGPGIYICQCLPTRRACIDAIPRLLRAMP